MASLALAFDILAKDNASATLNKVGDAAEKTGGKGKALGLALAGVAAAGAAGLFAVLKNGSEGFQTAQAAAAQFEAGLKSTGGVAGITTDQMGALADSIEQKTGTDADAIVSGGALLATFTKVRNELGAGNDVFTRATEAGVDLAARGFGSVESNAILLGKALNDPVKGLAALGKQGVTFTADQKALIGSLVETGDTLGAQKIILAEIEGQVGGSAEAYGQTLPGQLARARAAFDAVTEVIFAAVLPAITQLLEFVTTKLIPGFQSFADQIGPTVAQIGAVFRDTIVPAVVDAATAIASFIAAIPLPVLVGIGAAVAVFGGALLVAAGAAAISTAAVAAFNAVLLLNPLGVVIALLVGMVAGLVFAYKSSDTFRSIVDNAFAKVKAAAQAMADFVTKSIPAAFDTVKSKVTGAVEGVRSAVAGAFDAVNAKVGGVLSAVVGLASSQFAAMVSIVKGAVNVVVGVFTGDFGRIKDGVGQAIGGVISLVSALPSRILGAMGNLGGLLLGVGRDIVSGLARGIRNGVGAIGDALLSLIPGPLKKFAGALGINSPSKVFEGFGKNIGQGLSLGIDGTERMVSRSVSSLASAATMPATSFSGSFEASGMGGGSVAELLREQNDLLRGLPRGYMLGQRKMAGV